LIPPAIFFVSTSWNTIPPSLEATAPIEGGIVFQDVLTKKIAGGIKGRLTKTPIIAKTLL